MRKSVLIAASLAIATFGLEACSSNAAPGASKSPPASSGQGLTTQTLRVGMPYPNLAPVRALGVDLNQGNWADAYNALVANMNAHGGIDGRKILPYIVGVDPIGTAPSETACTQLTQDDKVFAALAPVEPDCYLLAHVATINGTFPGTLPSGAAPNFSLTPPDNAFDPLQLAVFAKMGAFKGKKVALVGAPSDKSEMSVVQSTLQKMHVDVVESAIETAPANDQVAADAQATSFVQRFKSEGVNEVVGVGSGSAWASALNNIRSTYNPPWIATSESSLASITGGTTKIPAKYLDSVLAATSTLPDYVVWNEPSIQKCVSIVRKAYPSDKIATPTPTETGSQQTATSVIGACENLALFSTIAKAAGKNLNEETFASAGYGLRNVVLPGSTAPISFGPGQPYAIGPVYVVTYDPKTNLLKYATTASKG